MLVRFKTSGLVREVNEADSVVQAWLASGRVVQVESEAQVAESPEVKETPEKPAGRGRRRAAPQPETR